MTKVSSIIATLLFSLIATFFLFNYFATEISNFNARTRIFVTTGSTTVRQFTNDGFPISKNPKLEKEFISPFYVVHYGLIYSDSCRTSKMDGYHWLDDPTVDFWPYPPKDISIVKFKAAANWVVENLSSVHTEEIAHLYYNFDWPYAKYPSGKLTAPWWSGLTDGHAITLMLRAWDCFEDQAYIDTAKMLYTSVTTPIVDGGSLTRLDGYTWIEEYVDPNVNQYEMSYVFNGMAYAYFGVKAFEEFTGKAGISDQLYEAITKTIQVFNLGYWSYYDGMGSRANIKYHNVNLALLEDPRLNYTGFDGIISDWKVGRQFPAFFYMLQGPNSIAKLHFFILFLMTALFVFGLVVFVTKKYRNV